MDPAVLDHSNRYLPAVQFFRVKNSKKDRRCSGVLVSPRIVLTAAHCVCEGRRLNQLSAEEREKLRLTVETSLPRNLNKAVREAHLNEVLGEENTLLDGMSCPGDVVVNVVEYPVEVKGGVDGGRPSARTISDEFWVQRVLPHEDFKLVYEKNSTTAVFRQVDLAMLVLNRPVSYLPRPARLTESEVKTGDRVVMVGYGFGRIPESRLTEDHRVVGESVISDVDVMAKGRRVTFYAREELSDGGTPSRTYGGDSGGPCFRKNDDMLIGIATAVTVTDDGKEKSIFTSIFPHKSWIKGVADSESQRVD